MRSDLASLAERQWRDYRAHAPGTLFADPLLSMSLAEAYALQEAVCKLRTDEGDRIAGYKVGCTGPGTIAQLGMAGPIRGFLFESEMRRSGDTLPACAFSNLAVEAEMALRIGKDGQPEAVFPVIELHNFVFRGMRKTLVELVANNGLNAGVVLPPDVQLQSGCDFPSATRLGININGQCIGTGGLWPLPGGAQASVEWLRSSLRDYGRTVLSGDLVLAGTPLGLYPVRQGDTVSVDLDGQALVECCVT